jgi:aryl-alcohol dehydrogenase-like predicted oxidoreductase
MNYNSLGKSDIKVSAISFGCMSLGNDHSENARLLHHAHDHGINYFDTANVYAKGDNEITIGKAFKEIRNKVIIATKVGNQWKKDGSGFDWNPSKEHIMQSVDESLERLQTDYIDLYQLHGGTIDDPIDETIEAFEFLKQQGKIREYGISSIRPNVIREYVKRSKMVSVMMQYSLLDRRPEESCLDLLKENNISVLVRGALAKGLLVNKPSASFLDHDEKEVHSAVQVIQNIGVVSQRTSSSIALQYVLDNSAVASVVVGIRTQYQLDDVLTFKSEKLSEKDLDMLRQSIKASYYDQHR